MVQGSCWLRPWGLRPLAGIDAPFSIESMYAHSRLLLRHGSPATVPEIRQQATQLRDRDLLPNISAQHGRLWNRLIVMLIVKRHPNIKKVQKLLVMGGCRRGRGLSIQEALQLPCQNGHFGGAPRAATDQHLSRGSAASLSAEPAGD